MGVEWTEYKGKRILYSDYSGIKQDSDSMKVLERQMVMIQQAAEPVLLLVNLQDATLTPEMSLATKEKLSAAGAKVKKIGLVGITPIKSVIVKGIGREVGDLNQEIFPSMEAAREWLIK